MTVLSAGIIVHNWSWCVCDDIVSCWIIVFFAKSWDQNYFGQKTNAFCLQHQANTEEGFKVREQVCKASKEGETTFSVIDFDIFHRVTCNNFPFSGLRIQHPDPTEDCEKERVCHGRGRGWGKTYSFLLFIINSFNKMGKLMQDLRNIYFSFE